MKMQVVNEIAEVQKTMSPARVERTWEILSYESMSHATQIGILIPVILYNEFMQNAKTTKRHLRNTMLI